MKRYNVKTFTSAQFVNFNNDSIRHRNTTTQGTSTVSKFESKGV